jgi:hypothetical protein
MTWNLRTIAEQAKAGCLTARPEGTCDETP